MDKKELEERLGMELPDKVDSEKDLNKSIRIAAKDGVSLDELKKKYTGDYVTKVRNKAEKICESKGEKIKGCVPEEMPKVSQSYTIFDFYRDEIR